ERKQDSEKQFYEFDRWVQDMAAADAKTIGRVRGSDVMALLVDFEEWKGVPIFEHIAEKWKNATDEEVYKTFEYPEEHTDPIDYDYYRRSNAYNEIWKMCERYLYHEEDVVYISMFGGYEIADQEGFVHKCRKAYEEWQKQFEKPKESEETE
ncbi:MAG: hypothetical protein UHH95_04350, partial [Oscillospiraceae bacterium]|nr:hypothetical protein [Oscillospiraceae bacterium]